MNSLKRTPLYRFVKNNGLPSGLDIRSQEVQRLTLIDFTALNRLGFKGADAPAFLSQTIPIPQQPNRAINLDDGCVVARLSQEEHLILCNPFGEEHLSFKADSQFPRVYDLPRSDSHSWFALTGQLAAEVLSKICAVDMRLHKFENSSIAQTSIAKINGIIIRNDLNELALPCFYILADISYAEFLWHSIKDAMQEFIEA